MTSTSATRAAATSEPVISGAEAQWSSRRTFSPTEERILTAALALIGRRGVRRLGMQEISEAAGVSRGTLYRYFPSKDHVLAAAAEYSERRFSEGAEEVMAAVTGPQQRISAFLGYAFDFIRSHTARSLFESEPDVVLSYLLAYLPALRAELVLHLGDALDEVPPVRRGDLDREQLAELIVRLFASSWIIPESDDRMLVRSITHILQIADDQVADEHVADTQSPRAHADTSSHPDE